MGTADNNQHQNQLSAVFGAGLLWQQNSTQVTATRQLKPDYYQSSEDRLAHQSMSWTNSVSGNQLTRFSVIYSMLN